MYYQKVWLVGRQAMLLANSRMRKLHIWTQITAGQAHHLHRLRVFPHLNNPAGVLVTVENRTIYHTGDTALTTDMKLYGDEGVDLALVPIGGNFTMDIADAVRAVEFIRPKCAIPMHYDTFDINHADPEKFKAALAGKGVECVILKPGASWELA